MYYRRKSVILEAGVSGLVGWLIGWLVGWLAGWLVGWLVWLMESLKPRDRGQCSNF